MPQKNSLQLSRQKLNTNSYQILDVKTSKGFENIYNLYWEKVYAVCYNNILKVELAQGMTQDIFKSLWERKDTLQVQNMEHYLVRSAKMKVFEYFRNKVSKQKHLDISCQNYCNSANCTDDDVSFAMLIEELDILVDKLPCRCREVFNMSRKLGFKNKEIASKLQISERAVEYHISKAISFLKTNLREHHLV